MTFANDGCAIRVHRDAHLGDVNGKERAATFTGKDAAGFQCFPVPAIKTEDPIGLGERVPTFDVMELTTMRLARVDTAAFQIAL